VRGAIKPPSIHGPVDNVHNRVGAETFGAKAHCPSGDEEIPMSRTSNSLPTRFPVGSKYVVESRGPIVRRYVEFPDGHKVTLGERPALSCGKKARQRAPAEKERSQRPAKYAH
jgi:hypothetical protein